MGDYNSKEEAVRLRSEQARSVAERAAATRSAEMALLVRKIESYERLLGNKMDGAKAQIKAVQEKLGKVTSRWSNLEV